MRQPSIPKPERVIALRLFLFLALVISCGREPARTPSIALVDASTIEVRDVPATSARPEVQVFVGERPGANPPVAGRTEGAGRTLRFHPALPLEAGRSYFVQVAWTPTASGAAIEGVVRTAARAADAPVRVTHVQPVLENVPENLLRLYIHFSGPMGRGAGPDHVRLLDAAGREVVDPFLPVEGEFWNADRTRYTLFFDPGRVKTGILPNERMGRPLRRGRRYTLVVDKSWADASARPLAEEFRQTFTPGPANVAPLAPRSWAVAAPRAGTRDLLTVRFPRPLDYGLLQRAIGVENGGRAVEGSVEIPRDAREWRFTPTAPWASAAHDLVVLSILEDPSGNRIGRAFEAEGATRAPAAPDRVLISWSPLK